MTTSSPPCGCKMALEPSPTRPLTPCDNAGNPAYTERGMQAIAAGASVVQVNFATEKVSLSYDFTELDIENLTDPNPINIETTIINKTTNGFKVALSGLPDTGNYFLIWNVFVTQVVTQS